MTQVQLVEKLALLLLEVRPELSMREAVNLAYDLLFGNFGNE
jgi:hypothetical protein